jgi:hypothetical protein
MNRDVAHGPVKRRWPETGLEEINGDLLDADFWGTGPSIDSDHFVIRRFIVHHSLASKARRE